MLLIKCLILDFLNLQWLFNLNKGPTDWKKTLLSNFSAHNKYKCIKYHQKSGKTPRYTINTIAIFPTMAYNVSEIISVTGHSLWTVRHRNARICILWEIRQVEVQGSGPDLRNPDLRCIIDAFFSQPRRWRNTSGDLPPLYPAAVLSGNVPNGDAEVCVSAGIPAALQER